MRHGYADIMDKAERKALEVSPTLAFECFTPQVYIAWVSNKTKLRSGLIPSYADAILCTMARSSRKLAQIF